MLAITKHKTFLFNLPRDVENNFKDKIDYIKIYYELLADQRIKTRIKQLFSKYNDGNDIHEHGKQQNI